MTDTEPPSNDEVRRLYVEERLSCATIGRMLGVSSQWVFRRVKAMNLPRHNRRVVPPDEVLIKAFSNPSKKTSDLCGDWGVSKGALQKHRRRLGFSEERRFLDNESLRILYLDKKMSALAIASVLGANEKTVYRHIKQMGIARTVDEARRNYNGKRQMFTQNRGYIMVLAPDHPQTRKGGRVRLHTLVAEKKLGRLLTVDEKVHHIDFVKGNNDPRNLWIYAGHREHRLGHRSLEEVAIQLVHKGQIGFKDGRYYLKEKGPPRIGDMRSDHPTVFSLETWAKGMRETLEGTN